MGYYQAGGLFGSIGKVFKKVVKAVSPVYKAIVKPAIGVAVASFPGGSAVSKMAAAYDPTSSKTLVGKLVKTATGGLPSKAQVVANPVYGVIPSQSTMGRTSQLLNPTAAPAGMPGEGSPGIAALFYKSLTQDERMTLGKALQYVKRSRR